MLRVKIKRVRKKLLRSLTAGVLILELLCSQSAVTALAEHSGQEAKDVEAEQIVRVAVQDYPNYLTALDNGRITGYAYEYLKEIQKYTGWKYEYVQMPFSDAEQAIYNGEIDIMVGCQKTEERMERCNFSEKNMGEGSILLCTTLEQDEYSFNDFEAYAGMRIAYLEGTRGYAQTKAFFEAQGVEVEFTGYESNAESIQALRNKEVDAMVTANIRIDKDYKVIARIQTAPWYFMLNKSRPELKAQIDAAMSSICTEEPYYNAKLDEKYFSDVLQHVTMSEEEVQYIKNAGEITVALSVDMNPIEYYDEKTGTYRGIVVDTFEKISETTGLKFHYVSKPSQSELEQLMRSGEVQLIGLVADNGLSAESLNVELTEGYSSGSATIVINSDVKDYRSLDCRVVVVDSTPFFEAMARGLGYTDITYAATYADCVNMVNYGDADITMLPDYSMDRLLNYPRYVNITTVAYPDSLYDYCVGVSSYADEKLLAILNKAILGISDEIRAQILIKNLTENQTEDTLIDFFYRYSNTIFVCMIVLLISVSIIFTYMNSYRKKMNRKLMVALERANSASQAKSDFLSYMSHDLRTPLNAVLGYSDPLVNASASPEEKNENLAKINLSGRYLMDMINNILDVVKTESGHFKLHYQVESIESFWIEIEAVIRPLAEEKGVSFKINDFDSARKYVISDKMRVKRIILNLLNNAIKFTPPGGTVELEIHKLKEENGRVYNRFIVRDNGIGMSEEFCVHAFEEFAQEDARKMEGSGLGLAIVKKLVEQLDGTIRVKSRQNEGTEFEVDLSFEMCDVDTADQMIAEKQSEECALKENDAYCRTMMKESDMNSYVQDIKERLQGKRVLLCEDHPINIEIARRMLERVGICVELAVNGQEAIEKYTAAERGYDIILMDIRMPVMDGLEASLRIRSLEENCAYCTPIVAITANVFEDNLKQVSEAGMNAYIAKPIEAKRLYEVLDAVCSGQLCEDCKRRKNK